MILNKALLIKGLAGLTTIAATGTAVWSQRDKIFASSDKNKSTQETEDKAGQVKTVDATSLITAVGLSCGTPSSSGTDCSMSSTPGATVNLNVKQEASKSDGITAISSSTGGTGGKIRLYSEDTTNAYKSGLKFVIEGGDVTLTGGSGSQTISKLEEFETYQIEEEVSRDTKKYYLSRKEKAADEIRRTLGLPQDCTFPETINSSSNPPCTIASDKIKDINFDGKATSEITNSSSSSLTLTITKVSDASTYPLGYKFSFKTTGSNNITVSTTDTNTPIIFRPNGTVDFKIKKEGNNGLKLEKDLTLNTLLNEVGLSGCTATDGSNECTIGTTGLNVKQGDSNKEEGKTKQDGSSGKIKLYTGTDATGYENNFKFFIEDGDINFGSSSGSITKLEEFETYEIKKETADNKWYFSRKSDALEEKKRILGLPEDCTLPTSSDSSSCSEIDATKLKAINFEGKGTTEPTFPTNKSVKLTITKVDSSDSVFGAGGYKFQFTSEGDITIPKTNNGENITIKANTNTEFKIKKSGNTLTLEKAWSVTELAKQVGLTDCASNECTIPTSDSLKLKNDDNDKVTNAKATTANQKIKYQEDVEGHNQGFKFYIDSSGQEISLTSGSDSKKIEKDNVSYEIKKDSNDSNWYLTKKSNGAAS